MPPSPAGPVSRCGGGRGRAHLALGEVQHGGQALLLAGADVALLSEAALQLLQLRGRELGAGPPGHGADRLRSVPGAAALGGLPVPGRVCGNRRGRLRGGTSGHPFLGWPRGWWHGGGRAPPVLPAGTESAAAAAERGDPAGTAGTHRASPGLRRGCSGPATPPRRGPSPCPQPCRPSLEPPRPPGQEFKALSPAWFEKAQSIK